MDDSTPAADEHPIRFDLLTENPVYKPFRYPWAYEAWLTQQRVHWLPEEVPERVAALLVAHFARTSGG